MLVETPIAVYLLIQGGRVVDHCTALGCLWLSDIDEYAGFTIAVGYQTEWGEKEVVGVIADVAPLPVACSNWRVTSETPGCLPYTINTPESPSDFVKWRLRTLAVKGYFDDLTNLPPTLTIKPR